jgi:hypothetical protein
MIKRIYSLCFFLSSLTVSNKFHMTKKVNITLLGFLFNILIISTIRKNKKEVDVFRFVRDRVR